MLFFCGLAYEMTNIHELSPRAAAEYEQLMIPAFPYGGGSPRQGSFRRLELYLVGGGKFSSSKRKKMRAEFHYQDTSDDRMDRMSSAVNSW